MAEEGHKVTLNVYDLSQGMARQLSTTFLGKAIEAIWHTGIVVYGNEYYFGGGIQHCRVGTTPYGTPMRVVEIGVTHVPKDMFETYLQEIGPRYTAETYNLLSHNCNNFSNEVAQFLVGATIPEYILNLPNEVMSSPMGPVILPMIRQLESTLRAGAVPQAPQFRPTNLSQPSQNILADKSTSASVPQVQDKKVEPKQVKAATKVEEQSAGKVGEDKKSPANGVIAGDALGGARNKIQDEIGAEFAAIMATGTLRASEAAALATRKVMQKHGHISGAKS